MLAKNMFDLTGRVALVTGASSGLGQIAADALLGSGARVVGVARREDRLREWASRWEDQAALLAADLTLPDGTRSDMEALAESASKPFGPPDILVNAAGINTREPADAVTAAGWDITLSLNLGVPFFLAQALVPAMAEKGWGRIVNFASLQSRRAFPGGIAYGASKGGVEQMTRAMAEAWSHQGITANALAPGFFPTELTAPVFEDPDRAARNAAQTCIGRNGTPEDMVGPILFFCSDASSYVTGQVLFIDGGYTAK